MFAALVVRVAVCICGWGVAGGSAGMCAIAERVGRRVVGAAADADRVSESEAGGGGGGRCCGHIGGREVGTQRELEETAAALHLPMDGTRSARVSPLGSGDVGRC